MYREGLSNSFKNCCQCVTSKKVILKNLPRNIGFKLIFILCFGFLTLFLAYGAIISYKIKKNLFKIFVDLKEPLLIGFATSSSFAAMPSMVTSLVNKFRMKNKQVKLLVPLSVCFNSQSSAFMYSVLGIFSVLLFHIPITVSVVLTVILGSIFISLAASGAPTFITYSMMSIILGPLGIPSTAIVPLFLAIAYFKDPFNTSTNILGHCMSVVCSGRKPRKPLISGSAVNHKY